MLKFITLFASILLSTASFGANIITCNKQTNGERLHVFFCACKTHLITTFRADPGGIFTEGEKVDVTIDGKSVGQLTLNLSGAKLTGTLDTKKKLPVPVVAGSKVSVGDLTCKLK